MAEWVIKLHSRLTVPLATGTSQKAWSWNMSNEFSVYQFFEDGSQERVREFVDAENAVKAARHYTSSVAARMGVTKRVIITDGGDCTVFEWQYGTGIVFDGEKYYPEGKK
jgi:hypothetical protein